MTNKLLSINTKEKQRLRQAIRYYMYIYAGDEHKELKEIMLKLNGV